MSVELWIPGRTVKFRCACGAKFFDKARGIRHAATCTAADDEMHEALAIQEGDAISSRVPTDVEAWKWGRKRIAEGKPGFRRGRPT